MERLIDAARPPLRDALKEQCVHRQRFEILAHVSRATGDRNRHDISLGPVAFDAGLYNHRRPHQALGMRTPAAAFN
ncbi:MAG: hypothetical protein AAF183_24390 [Pseudomonadota bacterium]